MDFCEFYGREMLRLAEPQPLIHNEAEENERIWVYIPLGSRSDYSALDIFPSRLVFQQRTGLRERRYEFSAWMVLRSESRGLRPAEAVDFCEFYGRCCAWPSPSH